MYFHICAGRLVALCKKAKLVLQFILIVQNWAVSGFFGFFTEMGEKIPYATLWIQTIFCNQLNEPPFKFSLPLTDQGDITVGVYHKALVWQSPGIRCYFSWLHYYQYFCIKHVFTFNEMPGKKMNSSEKTSLKKLKQL